MLGAFSSREFCVVAENNCFKHTFIAGHFKKLLISGDYTLSKMYAW